MRSTSFYASQRPPTPPRFVAEALGARRAAPVQVYAAARVKAKAHAHLRLGGYEVPLRTLRTLDGPRAGPLRAAGLGRDGVALVFPATAAPGDPLVHLADGTATVIGEFTADGAIAATQQHDWRAATATVRCVRCGVCYVGTKQDGTWQHPCDPRWQHSDEPICVPLPPTWLPAGHPAASQDLGSVSVTIAVPQAGQQWLRQALDEAAHGLRRRSYGHSPAAHRAISAVAGALAAAADRLPADHAT